MPSAQRHNFPRTKVFKAGFTSLGFGLTSSTTGEGTAGRTMRLAQLVRPTWGRHRPSPSPGPGSLGELRVRLVPPRLRPGPGLAGVGAGPTRSLLQALFPLVSAAARARKRTGAEAVEAEAPPPAGVAAASSSLGTSGARPGSHASHAPGPAGRLPAGLGGAAAGFPEHPGERQCGRPLASSPVCLAQGRGSGRSVSGSGELEVRSWGPWHSFRGWRCPGSRCPSCTLFSASCQYLTEAHFARAAAETRGYPTAPAGPRASREGLRKRPRPRPRFLTGEWPLKSEPAGPSLESVTHQTCCGRRPVGSCK